MYAATSPLLPRQDEFPVFGANPERRGALRLFGHSDPNRHNIYECRIRANPTRIATILRNGKAAQ